MLNVYLGSALLCRPSTRDQSNTATTASLRASIESLNVSFAASNVADIDAVKLLPIDINALQRAVVLAVQRGLSDSVLTAHARALSIYLRLQVPAMEAVNKLVKASEVQPLARSMSIAQWLADQLRPINCALSVIETVLRPARFSCTPSLPILPTADDTPTCGALLVAHILAPLHRSSESNQSLLLATASSLFAAARSAAPDSPAVPPLEQTEETQSAISLLTVILGEMSAPEMQTFVATIVTAFLDVRLLISHFIVTLYVSNGQHL
jgi:anti-sigma factor RsiW